MSEFCVVMCLDFLFGFGSFLYMCLGFMTYCHFVSFYFSYPYMGFSHFFNQNLGFDCWVSFILVNGWISYLGFYFLFMSGFHGIAFFFFLLECKSGFIKNSSKMEPSIGSNVHYNCMKTSTESHGKQ